MTFLSLAKRLCRLKVLLGSKGVVAALLPCEREAFHKVAAADDFLDRTKAGLGGKLLVFVHRSLDVVPAAP